MSIRTKVSRGSLQKENLLQAKAEKVEMTLNTDNAIASGLLIQRLTELYEDPVEASVRETVSNALDAVMEHYTGETPVIEITSPSSLSPVFSVKDNGIGMSYNDLKEIYSKYGASTKMDNMDQIGAYGLGAKAPLAYGTEFTVTSVKDGERTTIIVVREEMTNYIKIVDSEQTDAPSGTTVSIPVSSNDIERFNNHIEKYKSNPIDKSGVRLIIDHEEILDSEYIEVTDNMLIFDSSEGKVYGRLWIKKDANVIDDVISNMNKDSVKSSLSYLIGGWKYKNPSRRGYYGSNSGLLVELKAGIVAFNSSRDAILENDRYYDLENLVADYIASENFTNEVIETINKVDLDLFKEVVVRLVRQNFRDIYIKNDRIEVEKTSSYSFNRKYSISNFIHEETGFRFDDILAGIPKKTKQTAIIQETKDSYRKSVDNYMPSSLGGLQEDGSVRVSHYSRTNVSDAITAIDEIMSGNEKSHSLQELMMTLTLNGHEELNVRITFVTDVNTDSDEDFKEFRKTRTGRKTIVRMRNEDKHSDKYSSYIIYTSHTKKDIEKMIEEAKMDSFDLKVYDVSEVSEKVTEYRKKNRTASTSSGAVQGLDTSIYKLTDGSLSRVYNDTIKSEFDKNKTNVIVLSRNNYIDKRELEMVRSWYCNENDKKPSDVVVYSSTGQHRKVDLDVLKDLGELYKHPRSQAAGTSKLYEELLDGKIAGMHTINNNEDDIEVKSFGRLLSSFAMDNPMYVVETIKTQLNDAIEFASLAGIDMPKLNVEKLDKIGQIGNEKFGDSYNSREWDLNYNSKKQLIKNLTKEQRELMEEISVLLTTYNRYKLTIMDDCEFETERISGNLINNHNKDGVELAYADKNKDCLLYEIVRAQAKAYSEFIKNIIEKLSATKF